MPLIPSLAFIVSIGLFQHFFKRQIFIHGVIFFAAAGSTRQLEFVTTFGCAAMSWRTYTSYTSNIPNTYNESFPGAVSSTALELDHNIPLSVIF